MGWGDRTWPNLLRYDNNVRLDGLRETIQRKSALPTTDHDSKPEPFIWESHTSPLSDLHRQSTAK
jgi:hypothetical protein